MISSRIRFLSTLVVARAARLVMIMLVLCSASAARASEVTSAYLTDVWTADEGLPDSSVTALAQTPDGYLWIGTYNGLVRFDGNRFVTFDPANTPALAHARVRQLAVDAQGTLWINTLEGSMTSLRQGVFAREWTGAEGPDPDVTLLTSSSNRVAFLLHRGNIRIKPSAAPAGAGWEDLNPPLRSVGGLCVADGAGTIWYRTSDKRLVRWRGQEFEPLAEPAGLGEQRVSCMTTDAGGAFVGGDGAGDSGVGRNAVSDDDANQRRGAHGSWFFVRRGGREFLGADGWTLAQGGGPAVDCGSRRTRGGVPWNSDPAGGAGRSSGRDLGL